MAEAHGTALHGLAMAGLAGGDHCAVRLPAPAECLGVLDKPSAKRALPVAAPSSA
jgi:hypothetical protein